MIATIVTTGAVIATTIAVAMIMAAIAVEQCVREAERSAQRRTGSRAEVYEIRDVDRERRGLRGRRPDRRAATTIAIATRRGWGDRRRGDYRRGYRNAGWDEGRFSCDVRNGRVVDIDFDGIRGL